MAFGYNNAFLLNGQIEGDIPAGSGTAPLVWTARGIFRTGVFNKLIGRTPYVIDASQALEFAMGFDIAVTGMIHVILMDMGAAGTDTLGMWGDTALGQSNQYWTAFGMRTGPIIATGTVADLDADDYLGIQLNVSNVGTTPVNAPRGGIATIAGVYGSPGGIA
mgnify:CR=1 FL=1